MKKIYIFIVFAVLILVSPNIKASEVLTPVVAYSKVDKTETTTGGIIQYEINIDYDKRIKPIIPDIKKNLADFSLTEEIIQPEKNIDNRLVKTFIYKVQAKEPGSYIIQPVTINYSIPDNLKKIFTEGTQTKTSKIYIEIKSVLNPQDKDKDIDDIKDIEDIKITDYKQIFIYLLILIILALLGFLAFKKFKKDKKTLLAHEWAFKEINTLKKEVINQKNLKSGYFKISEIFRAYLEKRFEVNALQMTDKQLAENIKANAELDNQDKDFIQTFVNTTDFYKFTDSQGNYESLISLIDNTFNFVEKTKKIPEKDKK